MNVISKATNISRFAGFSVPPEPLRRESRPPPPNDPPAVEIFQVFPHSKLAIWVGKMIAICEEVSKQMFLLGGSFWVRPFYFIQGTSTFVDMVQAIFWSCKSPPWASMWKYRDPGPVVSGIELVGNLLPALSKAYGSSLCLLTLFKKHSAGWKNGILKACVNGLVQGKIYRKPKIFRLNMGLSCKFSLKPIHWMWLSLKSKELQ